MFKTLSIDIFASAKSNKLISLSLILLISYFWAPLLAIKIVEKNSFYTDLILTKKLLYFQGISTIIFLYIIFITKIFFKKMSKINRLTQSEITFNSKIAHTFTAILCVSSIPLIYFLFASNSSDRATLYSIIEPIRQNVFFSIIYSVALISCVIDSQNGNKLPLQLLLLFGVFPELFYGTRISIFRMFFLLAIVVRWNKKAFLYGTMLFVLIGFSRSLFNQYSSNSLYDLSILFLGDPINILLGSNKLLNIENISCGLDGMHAFRPFTFPFGFRQLLDPFLGDIVFCMSENGVKGLGNTITNEIYLIPLSVIISIFLLTIIFLLLSYYKINNLIQIYFVLLVISAFPYIVRNGLVATINHLLTILIWGLIPLFLAFSIRNAKAQKTRNGT